MSIMRIPVSLALSVMLFLSTVIPYNAQAATADELDDIFDRFQYSINVEWDQKDSAYKVQAEKELSEALDASGVTSQELTEYIATKILSGNAGTEFKRLLMAMEEQDLAPQTAASLAAKFMKDSYAEGAHFMGEGAHHGRKWTVVVVAIVVVVVAHWLIKNGKKGHDHDHDDDNDDDTVIIIVN